MSFKKFNPISETEITTGQPIDASLLNKIKDNFDNIKPRNTYLILDYSIDWSLASVFEKNLTGSDPASVTFSILNVEEGGSRSVVIKNTHSGTKTVNFSGVLWAESDPITSVFAGTTTIYTFVSSNGIVYATAVENMG